MAMSYCCTEEIRGGCSVQLHREIKEGKEKGLLFLLYDLNGKPITSPPTITMKQTPMIVARSPLKFACVLRTVLHIGRSTAGLRSVYEPGLIASKAVFSVLDEALRR
jgi:hypothetical protein